MRWIYSPAYDYGRWLPLPRRVHGFVRDRPSRIRAELIERHGVAPDAFERPQPVDEAALVAVHTRDVVDGLRRSRAIAAAAEFGALGALPAFIARHAIVHPQLAAAGGTALALGHAAGGEWAINLSGGYHHARPDRSHGFCLVNDVAWAVHALSRDGDELPRIAVIDLDLHQGDGNAAAFASHDRVFTASMHQETAFPFPKLASDLDVGLRVSIGDDAYLAELDAVLDQVGAEAAPDVVVYVAGTDPLADDAIGDLGLTADGLVERDRRVARFARARGAGLVVLPAGGYSDHSPRVAAAGFAAIAEESP